MESLTWSPKIQGRQKHLGKIEGSVQASNIFWNYRDELYGDLHQQRTEAANETYMKN